MNTERKYRVFTTADARSGSEPIFRNGEKPLQWAYFPKSINVKMVAVSSDGLLHTYGEDGRVYSNDTPFDLMIEENKVEWWINLYKNEGGIITIGGTFTSKLTAETNGRDDAYYLDTVKVWEEYV